MLSSDLMRVARLLSDTERPLIIVSWFDVGLGRGHLMLKAAVPVGGRAVSIYDEVHPLKRYNSPKTHWRLLERLATVVPAHCRPIIVTDAGFTTSRFMGRRTGASFVGQQDRKILVNWWESLSRVLQPTACRTAARCG